MTLKNIKDAYIIEAVNKQTIDSVTDEIREKSNGSYQQRGNKKYIIYKTQEEGKETSTIIIYDGKSLDIKRRGEIESNMTFKENEETVSLYIMPYGRMPIRIKTEKLCVDLTENGGTIHLKYNLIIQGEDYKNDMMIKIIEE